MAKKALCIGINDYPGTQSDLSGCVNDARDWADVLEARQFAVRMLLDAEATKTEMTAAIRELIESAQPDDTVVITYSGHGTWVPDTSDDETDGRDEGLCPHDINASGALLDDDLHILFSNRRERVRVLLLSDSCHSGSVTRGRRAMWTRECPGPVFCPRSLDAGGSTATVSFQTAGSLRRFGESRRRPSFVRMPGYRIQLGHPVSGPRQRGIHLLRHQNLEDLARRRHLRRLVS